MLIKEYRIPLPLTVEEYRIAQLFMIAVGIMKLIHGREWARFTGQCFVGTFANKLLLLVMLTEKVPGGDKWRRERSGDNS